MRSETKEERTKSVSERALVAAKVVRERMTEGAATEVASSICGHADMAQRISVGTFTTRGATGRE